MRVSWGQSSSLGTRKSSRDDGADGCTTTEMYLMPLNCALKMVKMVNFMFCVFYHSFFSKREPSIAAVWCRGSDPSHAPRVFLCPFRVTYRSCSGAVQEADSLLPSWRLQARGADGPSASHTLKCVHEFSRSH